MTAPPPTITLRRGARKDAATAWPEADALGIAADGREVRVPWDYAAIRLESGVLRVDHAGARLESTINTNAAMAFVRAAVERCAPFRDDLRRQWGFDPLAGPPAEPVAFGRGRGGWVTMALLAGLAAVHLWAAADLTPRAAWPAMLLATPYAVFIVVVAFRQRQQVILNGERITTRGASASASARLADVATIEVGREPIRLLDADDLELLRLPGHLAREDALLYLLHTRAPESARLVGKRWLDR